MKKYLKSGNPTEDLIQSTFFKWVFLQERIYPELKLFHHIANGGTRHIIEAKKFKAMGVRRGIPDTFLPVPKGQYHGLYIEFKSMDGEISEDQKKIITTLIYFGYRVEICRSPMEAINVTKLYLGI